MKRTLISMATLVALSSSALLADKEVYEVNSFNGFSVGTGMIATVNCNGGDSVTITGDKKDLKELRVRVEEGILYVDRGTSMGKIFNNIFGDKNSSGEIRVEVSTSMPLDKLEGSTGSSMKVDGCAVNTSMLYVDGGTGASINVEGATQNLELSLSTGGEFNRRIKGRFDVERADISLSTGASAYLCNANVIEGSGSTGATVMASESSETSNVSMSLGAEVSKKRCK